MPIRNFTRLLPGQTPTTADYNRITDVLAQESLAGGDGSVGLTSGAGGLQVTSNAVPSIWIRIGNPAGQEDLPYHDDSYYSWVPVLDSDPENGFPDAAPDVAPAVGGRYDLWPAIEIEGRTDVPAFTKLRAWLSSTGTFWIFRYDVGGDPSSSSDSSESASGRPSGSESPSESAGSGGGVEVVTDVSCEASTSGGKAGLMVKSGILTGSVTINGVTYPLQLQLSDGGSGG